MLGTIQTHDTISSLEAHKAYLWDSFKRHLQMSTIWNEYAAQARSDWQELQLVYHQIAALEERVN